MVRYALGAFGEGTDQLMLHTVADLTGGFTATDIDQTAKRLVKLVLVHFLLHAADETIRPPCPIYARARPLVRRLAAAQPCHPCKAG